MQMNPEHFLVAEAGRRDQSDYRFDWPTYFGWTLVTLGIFGLYGTYKLIERRREHVKRRLAFSGHLWHVLAARADAMNRRGDVQEALDNLSRIHAQIESYERATQREPRKWALLRIIPPVGAYVNQFLNADYRFLDTWETSLAQNVEWILHRLGYASVMPQRQRRTPERNTLLYVALTVATAGIFSVWWRYATMRDGNDHFDEDAQMENAILRSLGLAGPAAGPMPQITAAPAAEER